MEQAAGRAEKENKARLLQLQIENKLRQEQLTELKMELAVLRREKEQKISEIAHLEEQLKICTKQEMCLHTTLNLRRTVEKLEELMGRGVPWEEWKAVPRIQKWTQFFQNEIQHDYEDFVASVKSITNDPLALAKLINNLYGILNARVHNYIDFKEIDVKEFKDTKLQRLAECLGNIDVEP